MFFFRFVIIIKLKPTYLVSPDCGFVQGQRCGEVVSGRCLSLSVGGRVRGGTTSSSHLVMMRQRARLILSLLTIQQMTVSRDRLFQRLNGRHEAIFLDAQFLVGVLRFVWVPRSGRFPRGAGYRVLCLGIVVLLDAVPEVRHILYQR